MELSVLERLLLINKVLPKHGRYVELILTREIARLVDFTEEDVKKFEMSDSGEGVTWNVEKDVPVKFEFTESQEDLVRKRLSQMDSEGTLDQDHVSLYRKFVLTRQDK